MFGSSSKPVVFDPYRRQRSRVRVPRWLVLLLLGLAGGAGGVIYLQEEVLPPRLSTGESTELRRTLRESEEERVRLKSQLTTTTQQLQAAQSAQQRATQDLAVARSAVDGLKGDLAALVSALPPDPRGGTVQVRSGRFSAAAGKLDYDVVLTRERAGAKPLDGVMQLVVAGTAAGGRETSVTLKPVALQVGAHEVVRGSAALPDGFKPERTTINVLDRVAGRSLGMRVLLVQ